MYLDFPFVATWKPGHFPNAMIEHETLFRRQSSHLSTMTSIGGVKGPYWQKHHGAAGIFLINMEAVSLVPLCQSKFKMGGK